jgi:hypothetical protein
MAKPGRMIASDGDDGEACSVHGATVRSTLAFAERVWPAVVDSLGE